MRNGDLTKWVDANKLDKLPQSFSMLLSNLISVTKDNIDGQTVSSIIHKIASIYGALLLVQGNSNGEEGTSVMFTKYSGLTQYPTGVFPVMEISWNFKF